MQDVIKDIETLEDVLINLTEGASDEKRMALNAIERMIERKRQEIAKFEDDLEEQYMDHLNHLDRMEVVTGRY